MKTHIIAEAGTNHNGSVEKAVQLTDVAREAGADSVKFQMIIPEGLYLPRFYQEGKYVENEVFQKRKNAMLREEDFQRIARHARDIGIGFGCSVFDRVGLDALNRMEPAYVKIASTDLNNSRLIMAAAETGRKVVLSTGMSTLGEVERAVNDVRRTGNGDVVLMHCVSVYPARTEEMNLSFIRTLQSAFGLPVGFSDHTEESIASCIAVKMGVVFIEKHFTMDRKSEGFDHAYAMEPAMLASFIADVRKAEQACAERTGAKVGEAEANVRKRARRGLYAAADLEAGRVLQESDLLVVRPENGFAPNDAAFLVGKKLRRKVARYEALSLGQLEL